MRWGVRAQRYSGYRQVKAPELVELAEGLPHDRSECFGYGEVVDVYLQKKRDGAAAKRFFNRLLRNHGGEPGKIVTDKLRSYPLAHREVFPESIHVTDKYANNPAEQSHEPPRGARSVPGPGYSRNAKLGYSMISGSAGGILKLPLPLSALTASVFMLYCNTE